jgi:hypothetical protein
MRGLVGAYVRCWLHMEVRSGITSKFVLLLEHVRSTACLFVVALDHVSNQIAIDPPTSQPSIQ